MILLYLPFVVYERKRSLETLNELWKENGEKPIDVRSKDWPSGEFFHCVAITPNDVYIGWTEKGSLMEAEPLDAQDEILCS